MKTSMKKTRISLAIFALCAAAGFSSTSALAAGTASVAVTAAVSGNCKFSSANGTVSFVLDPASTSDATGTVTQPAFWCTKKTTYTITDDDGINDLVAGTQRMKHATLAEFIPYSFVYTTTGEGTGKGTPITLDIVSTVLNADFINASAGAYADTVTLTINP